MSRVSLHKKLCLLRDEHCVSFSDSLIGNYDSKPISKDSYCIYCDTFQKFVTFRLCCIMLNADKGDLVERMKSEVITLLSAIGHLKVKGDDDFCTLRQKYFHEGFIGCSYGKYFEEYPMTKTAHYFVYAVNCEMKIYGLDDFKRDRSRDGEYLQRIKELYFRLIPVMGIADEQYRNERINNAIDQFISE